MMMMIDKYNRNALHVINRVLPMIKGTTGVIIIIITAAVVL